MSAVFRFALLLNFVPLAWQASAELGQLESSATTAICTAASARQVVESFVDNFNRGDIQQLDKLVADAGHGFSWYSTDSPGQRINDEAYNRDTLMAYFMKRHDQHERLELQAFHFIATSGNGRGNFEFELTRSADDGLSSAAYGGKGAVDCSRVPSTLVVWSMAREPFLRSNLPTYIGVAALLLVVAAGVTTLYWRRRHAVESQTIS